MKRGVLGARIKVVALVLLLVVFLYPLYWFAIISLKPQREAFSDNFALVFRPTFVHYARLFSSGVNFARYYGNSVVVSALSTTLALCLGVPAAYMLSRTKNRWKHPILIAVLGSRMIPPTLFIIPYYLAFSALNLIDTLGGLVIIFLQFNLTMVIWSTKAFIDDVPTEIEESGFIDGASETTVFLRIVLPLASPGIVSTALLCVMLSWNEFVYPLILTQMNAMTASVAVVVFSAQEAAEWGMVAAGSILLTIPVIFFVVLVKRYLVRGLIGGALKE